MCIKAALIGLKTSVDGRPSGRLSGMCGSVNVG
jgi:hypothetical protein